jgi:hypothetical protein
MKNSGFHVILALYLVFANVGQILADGKTKAIQETAELVMAKFGSRAGLPTLIRELETFTARYGEEALAAVRRVGPEAMVLVEKAGTNGQRAAGLLARFGEEGASCVLRRPKAMEQFIRFGDDAAVALVKHPGIGEPLIDRGGLSAVKALGGVTPRDGRRLAMLMDGEIGKLPGSEKLLDVVAKYGQRACDFAWENKLLLASGAVMAAFLANPEPFLNGSATLMKSAGEVAIQPLTAGIGKNTNWTVIGVVLVLAIASIIAIRAGLARHTVQATPGIQTGTGTAFVLHDVTSPSPAISAGSGCISSSKPELRD